jgi:tetratricopeptide (TPR) repeat protein
MTVLKKAYLLILALIIVLFVSSNLKASEKIQFEMLSFPFVNEVDLKLISYKDIYPRLNQEEKQIIEKLSKSLESFPRKRRPKKNELINLMLDYYNAQAEYGRLYPNNYKAQMFIASQINASGFRLESMGHEEAPQIKEHALKLTREITEKFPNEPGGFYQLGFLLSFQDNLDESIKHTKQCLRLQRGRENCKELLKDLVKRRRRRDRLK